MKLSTILILPFTLASIFCQGQDQGLKQLSGFLGAWDHKAIEHRPNGSVNEERGSMEAAWFLDNTYLKIDCELSGTDYTRYYTQFIGFDSDSKEFISTYLYSGTIEKVIERGQFDAESKELRLEGVNPFSSQLESGINIKSTFKISENEIVLELLELRPNGKWELGYKAIFSRR